MTIEATGEQKGTLPASTKGYNGLVNKIIFAQNVAATGIVTIKQGTVIVRQFNTPAASGAQDPTFHLGGEGLMDPTQFSITPDAGTHGVFVTYEIK